jgi:hypothetical protein
MSDPVQCPACGREFSGPRAFCSHWGLSDDEAHAGDTPDAVDTTPDFSEKHRERISEAKRGGTRSEEHRQAIAETLEGNDPWNKGLTKEDHPGLKKLSESMKGTTMSEETREKISEIKRKEWREGNYDDQGPFHHNETTVDETGHTVQSSWEAEIDRLFHHLGVDYEYEPRTFTFENGRSHTPDFIVNETVAVEVKGYPVSDWDKQRAKHLMREYPEYTYMVVGSKEIPSDITVSWDNRQFVAEVV